MATDNTVTIISGGRKIVFHPLPGFTGDQIVALLNGYEAEIKTNRIVAYTAPPEKRVFEVAIVLQDNEGEVGCTWRQLAELAVATNRCSACRCGVTAGGDFA
jgi:hypothetical protein